MRQIERQNRPQGPHNPHVRSVEWPTLALIVAVHAAWLGLTAAWGAAGPLAGAWALVPLAVVVALHSSLTHEVAHGHPLRSRRASEALVFLPLGLAIPYERFRDLHLAHHRDERLTDPYDDPESHFLDPAVWAGLPGPLRRLMLANNTLAGRMVLGPLIGQAVFMTGEARAAWRGDPAVWRAWALHALGLMPVVAWLAWVGVPWWGALAYAYGGLAILRIRTFLEHRAHERAAGRSVVIERGGVLGFLFLNNNLHALHHAAPKVAWYRLPALWQIRREDILRRNRGYCFDSYAEVFALYLWRRKDPVAHPLMPAAAVPRPAARPTGRDIGGRDIGRRDTERRDTGRRDIGGCDSGRRDIGERDGGAREIGARDGGAREIGAQDGGAREAQPLRPAMRDNSAAVDGSVSVAAPDTSAGIKSLASALPSSTPH